MKRKADKLTQQSFALLEQMKARKEKAPRIATQNQIEQLYRTIFNKSPIANDTEGIQREINVTFASQKEQLVQAVTEVKTNKQ